jgi:hypothetical protein
MAFSRQLSLISGPNFCIHFNRLVCFVFVHFIKFIFFILVTIIRSVYVYNCYLYITPWTLFRILRSGVVWVCQQLLFAVVTLKHALHFLMLA